MFVSKAGKVQLIDDGTLPYWQGLGWVETSEADAIAAPTQTNPGGVLTPAAPVGGTPLASGVTVTPVGNIASTDVQAALAELDSEKADATATTASLALKPSKAQALGYALVFGGI